MLVAVGGGVADGGGVSVEYWRTGVVVGTAVVGIGVGEGNGVAVAVGTGVNVCTGGAVAISVGCRSSSPLQATSNPTNSKSKKRQVLFNELFL